MKRTALALAFLLALGFAFREEGVSQQNLVKEIAPGVFYRVAERDKRIIANTGWVVFRDYVLVIDANFPWGARAVLADIKKTTNKPIRFVFDTHYHGDHAFGNSVFVDAGATIVSSAEAAEESLRKNTPSWAKSTESGEYSLKPYRLEHPQIRFAESMVFDDGTMRVELTRLGPGHSRGDAIAYLPKQRILFTGDLATNFAGNNMADADADHDNWLRALDAMGTKDIAMVVPGHGDPGPKEILAGQRAYLAAILNGVRDGIAAGKSADEVAKMDLSAHKPWGGDPNRNLPSIRAVYAKLKK